MTPGRDHIQHQGYNLNKFGRGPLVDATYQNIKVLGHVISDIFFCVFSIEAYVKHLTPGTGLFGPRGVN